MDHIRRLLMIGTSSCTYQIGNSVVKIPRIDQDDAAITQDNSKATAVEANVYTILGPNERIANCRYICPTKSMIVLDHYPNGNLKDYIALHGQKQLCKWALQMIESIAFIHRKGVRHSDIRLEQWLLDDQLNARLSDFNASGHDDCPSLGIQMSKALGVESVHHYMPRDPTEDNTVASDLFALGSALYELENDSVPWNSITEEEVTRRFENQDFPPLIDLKLGLIIQCCWEGQYPTTTEMLQIEKCGNGARHDARGEAQKESPSLETALPNEATPQPTLGEA